MKGRIGKYYAAKTVMIPSLQMLATISLTNFVALDTKKTCKKEPGLFSEEVWCSALLCLCSKTYWCHDPLDNKFKVSSEKKQNKRTFEDSGDGPMAKYRKVRHETEIVTSTNRGFRSKNHCVANYEQTMKQLSCFCLKRIVESDGVDTPPL